MENKKSIFPIICVILLSMNLLLTGAVAFFTVPATSKMNKLLNQIGKALDLDFAEENPEEAKEVPMGQRRPITIEEAILVNLSSDGSSTKHMLSVSVGISLDSKAKDYEKISEQITTNMGIVKNDIRNTIAKHTYEEISNDNYAPILEQELTAVLKERFETDTIVVVYFDEYIY
ncbi:MAG: hypothetical protein K0R15_1158 [Clostridiales bacterium]|jgi:flagellar basal body-associated protein FliL|nr:hypothetical protein [Clostridiales bacterium]